MKITIQLEDADQQKIKDKLWEYRNNPEKAVQEVLQLIKQQGLQELEKELEKTEKEKAHGWRSYINMIWGPTKLVQDEQTRILIPSGLFSKVLKPAS
jgi:hypothetical protein